jgi:hypothetical protein
MFFFLQSSAEEAGSGTADVTVSQALLLSQDLEGRSPSIQSGLVREHAVDFSRATNQYLYWTSGFGPVMKWDGIASLSREAGVVAPTTAVTIGSTGSGTITGSYSAYLRFIDVDGNPSNLSPISEVIQVTNVSTILYTNVQSPNLNVSGTVKRQILRNTSGQTLTYYVDVETEDLTSTSLQSTRTDAELRVQEPVPLFSEDFTLNLASRFGVPPNDRTYIAFYANRLWLYGEAIYDIGHVEVANGSTAVTGVGTEWTTAMEGRQFYTSEGDKAYTVATIDEAAQTLVLDQAYLRATDKFARYTIRPVPEHRHLLSFSEPGQFDAWNEERGLIVASSDDVEDEPTGLAATQSFLFILQRRHIYRLSFLTEPGGDGGIFLSARRGCINNRSWVSADGFIYALDDRGIYRFDGSDNTEDLSQPIQDLFYFDSPAGSLRINWRSARFFHASHDRNDATIRWFVSLSGNYLPRHAICFNYGTPQWWLEEYPHPVGHSTILKSINPVSLAASAFADVFAVGVGTLDGLVVTGGDTRGGVVTSEVRSLTSTGRTFPTTGVVGNTIAIVAGTGKGQTRVIASVAGQTIVVAEPWTTKPDITSTFQIGAVRWSWKSGWNRWDYLAHNQPRRLSMSFEPATAEALLDLRLYKDYSRVPENWGLTWPRNIIDSSGVVTRDNDPDAVVNLEQDKGFSVLNIDSFSDFDEWRRDNVAVEIRGFSGESPVIIYELNVEGASES